MYQAVRDTVKTQTSKTKQPRSTPRSTMSGEEFDRRLTEALSAYGVTVNKAEPETLFPTGTRAFLFPDNLQTATPKSEENQDGQS